MGALEHYFMSLSQIITKRRCYSVAYALISWLTMTISVSASTLNVVTFGAAGDGKSDDTAAIQAAVNASASGDTISFPAGSYKISSAITIQSSRTYSGTSATILIPGGKYSFATPYNSTNNLTITGLIFDGGPIAIQGDGTSPANNITITKCTFQNITDQGTDWTTHQGIFITGIANSYITYNTFHNILPGGSAGLASGYGNGIWANNVSNTTISNNIFDTVSEGMYLTSDSKVNRAGIVIANNAFTNVHRMGIEMQINLSTVEITANTFSAYLNPFPDTFGISFASPSSTATIQGNTMIAMPPATTFVRYGYAIEAAGINTQVLGNSIQGNWSAGVAIGGSQNLSVTGNTLCGSTGSDTIFDESGATVTNPVVSGNAETLVCSTTSLPLTPVATPTPVPAAPPSVAVNVVGVTVSANAASAAGISSVAFVLDGTQPLAAVVSPPYQISIDTTTLSNGLHTLTATATDLSGATSKSSPVSISVQNSTPVSSLPAGMSLQLDAVNITPVNGKVAIWADSSGTNLFATQPLGQAQPSLVTDPLSGRPAVSFDGSRSWMSVPLSIEGLTGMTVFLVSANSQNSTYGYGISAALVWNETAAWGTTFVGPFQDNVSYRFGTTQVSNSPTYTRPSSIGDQFSLTETKHSGDNDSLSFNGTLVLSQSGKAAAIQGTMPILNLGQTAGGASYFGGDIAEAIIYPRALSAAEEQQVTTYLMQKYLLH
jgi:hypothetical protein